MKYKVPFILVIICLAIVAAVYGVYSYFAYQKSQSQAPVEHPVATTTLQTYTNEKYGFEIQHPSNWQVSADEKIPGVHIYKKSDTKPEYLTHHSSFTHVSIYPKGIGTEGVMGQIASTTIVFKEKTKQVFDQILFDNTHWGTFATFEKVPENWESWGYVWSGVKVENETLECVDAKTQVKLDMDKDCYMGSDYPGIIEIRRSGSINQEDRKTQEQILASFRFIK